MDSILPDIWGPSAWIMFHSITFSYPNNPTYDNKQKYLKYFECMGNILPCDTCRTSYQQFIKTGDTLLNMDTMQSRDTLTLWGWNIHNAVNKKLDVDYGVSYSDMCNKYETYRVRCPDINNCIMPAIDIKHAHNELQNKDPQFVSLDIAKLFVPHANKLKLYNYEKQIIYYSKLKHNTPEWKKRNNNVFYIIKYMRKKEIQPINNNILSIHSMLLLSMLSSTLTLSNLKNCATNIEKNI